MGRLKDVFLIVISLLFIYLYTINLSVNAKIYDTDVGGLFCSKDDPVCNKDAEDMTGTMEFQAKLDEILEKESKEDASYPEKIRKKRQLARDNFQTYVQNMEKADYDVRYDEGWQSILYPFGKWTLDNELMGQAGRETQTNLGFDCPYFGYRFNYTFVYPMGFVSFAQPSFQLPPFTFPNPEWPKERDHSFIAPFYADAAFQRIGNVKISNVFYRSVHRPRLDDDEFYNPYDPQNTGGSNTNVNYNTQQQQQQYTNQQTNVNYNTNMYGKKRKKRQMPGRINQPGMVIDPYLLDNITRDVQEGYTGANGWRAEHAFIVTWYRMAYGGAPRALDVSQFDYVKDWQNTFQLVIATDEIRTFALFNYARLNWTSSTDAGGLNGFGGKQPAMVGFNGGNGTGWYPLPYSGEGRVWKLGYFSNGVTPGRWIHRIDEVIIPGGCSNGSTGGVITAPPWGPMQGGIAVNISGPCLREKDAIKMSFESWVVDCKRISVARARCIMPMFHKTGLVAVRMSRDGGASFPYTGKFYVMSPHRSPPQVKLKDDVEKSINRWNQPYADQLSMAWQYLNLTWSTSARVDISLWGYWEDADRSHFEKIDILAKSIGNSGSYSFKPSQLTRTNMLYGASDKFHFGFVQVALSDVEDGVMWSGITPFPWYYRPIWEQELGSNWATTLCIDWFEYDGRRRNFISDLSQGNYICPCILSQALLDLGRFMPDMTCDMDGDTSCPFNKGAQHCVQSVSPSWTGAAQVCCYDFEGYLMFTDDWEPDGDYTTYFQPGTPSRAHPFGAYPYKNPPFIPSLSHYQNDILPYQMCCHYAQHCEFYYWRRMTNGCQDYKPPVAGYIYGEPHIITYDGLKYTFPGKGYYVLAMSENPIHKLMVQVRLEQPDETLWHSSVNATVVTGVAIQENSSSIVQIFARKPMRRWRYRMDVYVDGVRRFFDQPQWKFQQFNGVNLRSPLLNMDMSEIIVMLNSGAGVKVSESNGMLDVMVFLSPSYNTTCKAGQNPGTTTNTGTQERCYTTLGLLGTYNKDPTDDLMTITGTTMRATGDTYTQSTTQQIYEQFGQKWLVDGSNDRIGTPLFQDTFKPIYNPSAFASSDYIPTFWPQTISVNASRVFTLEQVKVACMEVKPCEYDYILTGSREVATTTLQKHKAFLRLQKKGSKLLRSCGPLMKAQGVIKTPPAANYLEGDTVTFSCKPNYYAHGDLVRTCRNTSIWTEGHWVWCRNRNLEIGLKWMTALLSIFGFLLLFTIIFCILWSKRKEKEKYALENGKNIRAAKKRILSLDSDSPKKSLLSRETTNNFSDNGDSFGNSMKKSPPSKGFGTGSAFSPYPQKPNYNDITPDGGQRFNQPPSVNGSARGFGTGSAFTQPTQQTIPRQRFPPISPLPSFNTNRNPNIFESSPI
uniref:AMOP domain-containing protein n=1 Tax=Strongyloides papillosus TaxID=174720 RepID=A0A0N5BFW0_STREA